MSFRNDRLKRRLEGLSTPPMQIHRDRTPKIGTGDDVRVHPTAEAITAGVAGMVGVVVEMATPSDPEVAVIGTKGDGPAVNVSFKDREGTFWFAKNQLELVSHAAAPEPAPQVEAVAQTEEPAAVEAKTKPWWRFGL